MTEEYVPMFPKRDDNWDKPEMTEEEFEAWIKDRIKKDKVILDALGRA